MKIKNQEDFWAGLMFVGFGVLAIYMSQDYPMGTASRMGPGYFPTWLGGIMLVLGAIVTLLAIRPSSPVTVVKGFAWKAAILLSIGFLVFGWGVDHIGFIPSLIAITIITSAAGQRFRIVEVLILSVVLTAGAVGIFIYGVELPFPLFWWR